MNRHVLSVCAITALGLAALPGPSIAQQKSSKDMLVGAWTLLLADGVKSDGTHVPQFGPNPDGMLMFSPTGRYSVQFERANLPKIKGNDRDKATPDESKAITAGSLAHFGTYSVNDADKTFTMHIEFELVPELERHQAGPQDHRAHRRCAHLQRGQSLGWRGGRRHRTARARVAEGEIAAVARIRTTLLRRRISAAGSRWDALSFSLEIAARILTSTRPDCGLGNETVMKPPAMGDGGKPMHKSFPSRRPLRSPHSASA